MIKRLIEMESELIPMAAALTTDRKIDGLISDLRIPCYNKFTTYHYYDVIHALNREVFHLYFEKRKMIKTQAEEKSPATISPTSSIHSLIPPDPEI